MSNNMRVVCTDTKDTGPFFQIRIEQKRAFVQICIVIIRSFCTNTYNGQGKCLSLFECSMPDLDSENFRKIFLNKE